MHPELRSAQLGIERAQLLVQRAENESIPNITVGAGYTRCLLYTSDAADERSSVDLGGRRIIKKKTTQKIRAR